MVVVEGLLEFERDHVVLFVCELTKAIERSFHVSIQYFLI